MLSRLYNCTGLQILHQKEKLVKIFNAADVPMRLNGDVQFKRQIDNATTK